MLMSFFSTAISIMPDCGLPFVAIYGAMNRKDWRTIRIDDITFDARERRNELLPTLRRDAVDQLG